MDCLYLQLKSLESFKQQSRLTSFTFFKNTYLRLYLLILERKREVEKHQCEKRESVASCICSDQGSNLQPIGVQSSNQLSHLVRASFTFLIMLSGSSRQARMEAKSPIREQFNSFHERQWRMD